MSATEPSDELQTMPRTRTMGGVIIWAMALMIEREPLPLPGAETDLCGAVNPGSIPDRRERAAARCQGRAEAGDEIGTPCVVPGPHNTFGSRTPTP